MLRDIRIDYQKYKLNENELSTHPMTLFGKWLDEALSEGVIEPTAMVLCTVSGEVPDSRVVLLKDLLPEGFVFYTNYLSQKGRHLEKNPHVSLNFFWAEMERQVRVKGIAGKQSIKKSRDYFKSRPRDSQLGACASNQSEEIESREKLEDQFRQFEIKFENKPISMPEYWGGYVVKPFEIEFWQGRSGRMHDRILFYQNEDEWFYKRLQP